MFIIFCKLSSVMAEGQIYKIHSDFYYVQKDGQSFEFNYDLVKKLYGQNYKYD